MKDNIKDWNKYPTGVIEKGEFCDKCKADEACTCDERAVDYVEYGFHVTWICTCRGETSNCDDYSGWIDEGASCDEFCQRFGSNCVGH